MKFDRYLGGELAFGAFVIYVLLWLFDMVEVIGLIVAAIAVVAGYLNKGRNKKVGGSDVG